MEKTIYTIVIEGCDLCGKSTLVKRLSEKYNLDIMHCTSHDPKDYTFYFNLLRKKNVVYDREWIGELIYPEIYMRISQLSIPEANNLMKFSNENNVKTLVLTCENEELQKRLSIRGEEVESVKENLSKINDSFVKYANQFNIPLVDTSKVDFEDICHYIETGEINW